MARRSDHTREELGKLILISARRIVREHGIDALSARKVASDVGYTVGTIYQHFGNMDDLVHRMNGETLEMLFDHCSKLPTQEPPGDRLFSLARAFVNFAEKHPSEWDAVISYRYGPDHEWAVGYDEMVNQLLGLLTDATSSLYCGGHREEQVLDIRLLWASMYGIFSLHASDRLGKGVTVDDLARRLVDVYLRAMR
ncbi:TetR/AcrR family transcriptional regulator [Actibacterium pelagium]|nr:TetR/AcrR family transcriptional regulator [Actibacterium pelagium]